VYSNPINFTLDCKQKKYERIFFQNQEVLESPASSFASGFLLHRVESEKKEKLF